MEGHRKLAKLLHRAEFAPFSLGSEDSQQCYLIEAEANERKAQSGHHSKILYCMPQGLRK